MPAASSTKHIVISSLEAEAVFSRACSFVIIFVIPQQQGNFCKGLVQDPANPVWPFDLTSLGLRLKFNVKEGRPPPSTLDTKGPTWFIKQYFHYY